jgi:hypothetical protein
MEETKHNESLPGRAAPEIIKSETDFDRSEPRALLITGFGIATIIGLIAVILGIQAYFDHIREQAVYEKVDVPVSDDLKNLHSQENEELNTYKYIDRKTGAVQIPISRAMQLIAQEAAANKLKYFQKPTPVKVPGAPAADGTAPAGGTTNAPEQGKGGPAGSVGSSLGTSSAPGSTGNK